MAKAAKTKKRSVPMIVFSRARDIPFVLHTGDLNRVGEFLRSIGAPILAKPRAAEDVIGYIMNMARGQDAPRT